MRLELLMVLLSCVACSKLERTVVFDGTTTFVMQPADGEPVTVQVDNGVSSASHLRALERSEYDKGNGIEECNGGPLAAWEASRFEDQQLIDQIWVQVPPETLAVLDDAFAFGLDPDAGAPCDEGLWLEITTNDQGDEVSGSWSAGELVLRFEGTADVPFPEINFLDGGITTGTWTVRSETTETWPGEIRFNFDVSSEITVRFTPPPSGGGGVALGD